MISVRKTLFQLPVVTPLENIHLLGQFTIYSHTSFRLCFPKYKVHAMT